MKLILSAIIFCLSIIFLFLFYEDVFNFQYIRESYLAVQSQSNFFTQSYRLFYGLNVTVFLLSFFCSLSFILFICTSKKIFYRGMIYSFAFIVLIFLIRNINF